ncbi:ATP-dependent DNA ligase [Cellulomonas sp. P22]|uniref:ATP-dependent DNA ligase n=1 Tax=Cellulomonas sp. P22 TaxID=3373189 RepID=UPI0037A7C0BA
MLATGADPQSGLPAGPGWAYEVKWDGVRVLADTTGGRLRLLSRTGRDVSAAYPELAPLASVQGAVLDGEVVAMAGGVPSFEALAERMHVRDPARAERLAHELPVAYLVFDILVLYGVDITRRSFDDRRATLERLALPAPVQLSPVYPDGAELWEVTREHGLEGVVAKRRASTYQPGRRSHDWVKAAHRTTRTALVAGWRPATSGGGALGAVLLAAPDAAGRLRYLGRAGSGITGRLAEDLARRLAPHTRDASPFDDPVPAVDARGTTWCDPVVALDVTYLHRTQVGRLRHPVVRGVRDDTGVDPWEEQ